MIATRSALIDVRNNPVRHPLAVLLPVRAVLLSTAEVVATRSMDQEDRQEDDVGIGQQDAP